MSSQSTPLGVAAILSGPPQTPQRTALSSFALPGRVAVITGAHRGIGLEIALALAEAGASVYCIDLAPTPDDDWCKVQKWVSQLPQLTEGEGKGKKGKMEYASGDVTDQEGMWRLVEEIAKREGGRIDICVACAGILRGAECLEYPGEEFSKLMNVNVNGVLYTAQAAGRQMVKAGIAGSIILIASMSGSMTNKDMHWTAYNTSKAAVIQMARSMACELGPKGIRVNSISPGYVYTEMTKAFLDDKPDLKKTWCSENPLGRLAQPHEMRGVALWLAGDMSTFCTGSDIIIDGGHRAW